MSTRGSFNGVLTLSLAIAFMGGAGLSRAADWPQWRGPARDGVWTEEGLVERFDSPQVPIKWRVAVGSGYSGPTVAEGRVFVMDRVAGPSPRERVLSFDAETGPEVWSYAYDCRYQGIQYEAGPRCSVTIDEGRAYALGAMGHLHCLDARSGKLIWKHDCRQEYGAKIPIWGIAASPLVEGGLVIVHVGGGDKASVIAFDKVTGQERWRALNDPASYSSPVMIEQAGRRVFVCLTGERMVGLNPQTGDLYWESAFRPKEMVITIATPVFDGSHLVATSFYDGMLLLKVRQDELAVEKLWQRRGENERNTDALHCCISTPLILGDHIYGVDSHGELRCLDLKTGDRVWEDLTATPKARWSNVHMVRNGDRIWMFNERGELIIAKLDPAGFHEISRAKLIEPTTAQLDQRGGVCWSHPAFADRRVYARNDKELVCASLSR